MKITKRDLSEVEFDKEKIYKAIMKAMTYGSGIIKKDVAREIADEIEEEARDIDDLDIYKVESLVFEKLVAKGEVLTARTYEGYRAVRAEQRQHNTTDKTLVELLDGVNTYWNEENSNKNARLVTTQRDYMAGILSTDMTLRMLLPADIVEAHKEGIIHFHDADYFGQKALHNCCLINLEDMLQNGTVISGVKIDKPHSFSVACNIALQIVSLVASSQYGGQTISLSHLAPFVNESRKTIRDEVYKEYKAINGDGDISDEDKEKLEKIVAERLHKEIEKGVQTLQYQTITLSTTNGQAPFLSVNMDLGEVSDPQTKHDLALVIEEVLHQRIKGVKNEVGAWITPAFPKLLYVLDEDNVREGSEYFYLTKLAAECSAKRMVPDYISAKKMREYKIDVNGKGNVYPCMGCVDGDEVVAYRFNNQLFMESFEKMWNRLENHYEVKTQPNGKDKYMDTPDVEIYDSKNGFVENYRVIRNLSQNWLQLKFSNGRALLCTDDHPFETENRGVVLAKDLAANDVIVVDEKYRNGKTESNGTSLRDTASLISKETVERTAYSYDVTTASEHFTVSGIYSHNCRSFLTPYIDPDTGESKYYGRFNQGVVTLNLPDIALSSGGDFDKFWELFDIRTELCHRALQIRHQRLEGTPSDVAPILWQHGALARLKKGEPIDKLLHNGYSTLSLGYAGLYECVKYMTGHSHTDGGKGFNFGMEIMQKLNDKCNQWKQAEHIDYSLYGTPIETTTYKFAKCLQKRFGIVEGITDRDYITNSYHVPVFEEINAFDKLELEAQFQKLSPGGAISYVEIPNVNDNLDVVLQLIQFMYDNIMYAELNSKSDYCMVCGYDKEIKIVTDKATGRLEWECPNCGNRDQSKMSVARRSCGYIGTHFWNQGRTQEIKERVLHIDDKAYQSGEQTAQGD